MVVLLFACEITYRILYNDAFSREEIFHKFCGLVAVAVHKNIPSKFADQSSIV